MSDQRLHGPRWLAALLLWLAGNGLRLTILAVPPVIAMIRDEFALSATEVGLLSQHPAGAVRDRRAGGLAAGRASGRARARWSAGLRSSPPVRRCAASSPNFGVLLATTVVMSAGVAIMQPIMPTAVRQWLPGRIGLGTAIYTNGLLVGEILADAADDSVGPAAASTAAGASRSSSGRRRSPPSPSSFLRARAERRRAPSRRRRAATSGCPTGTSGSSGDSVRCFAASTRSISVPMRSFRSI